MSMTKAEVENKASKLADEHKMFSAMKLLVDKGIMSEELADKKMLIVMNQLSFAESTLAALFRTFHDIAKRCDGMSDESAKEKEMASGISAVMSYAQLKTLEFAMENDNPIARDLMEKVFGDMDKVPGKGK